ncbi:MAG: trehalose-6-phosphate synthase [Candidatus Brocadia sp.]|uniref:Alpha,alpha-trehalose-phosphate synthase n=1 Tax=Candidatus Brocadia fulgida TaxID=380242 RepID=A0A0M2UYV3_9BACT|nr:MAG: alpha,alpha-trehalose-phosphate synthase [Candidatus Brocadia fulgida]UJS21193.1 MAG: trehalose-6-phosphate synthase [Candidatus Brocadia sp.]
MIYTKESIKELISNKLKDYKLIVVSNREPYIHYYAGEEIKYIIPASGMVTALDPIIRAEGGTWIAHGSGDADKEVVDGKDCIAVPPDNPQYTLRRVWLTHEEEEQFYYGFSNEALWPLCHIVYVKPKFQETDWLAYKSVNQKFANVILEEVGNDKAFVFIQDYHFTLLPRMLKESRPDLLVAQFWHIPWPNREAFRICPWGQEILEGLLGNDLLGFHIQYHCNNFLDTIDRNLESKIDYSKFTATKGGKVTHVRPFPISIDFEELSVRARSVEVENEMMRVKKELGLKNQIIGVGLDRVDYTKGIPERFKAIDRFLERYPEYKGRFTFIQAGTISRIQIDDYRNYNDIIYDLMVEINHKYHSGRWTPLRLLKSHFNRINIQALYRLSDICIVSSLHDGMNLVAKEFIATRFDESGVLLLSRFTGAAEELTGSIQINPYATDTFAEAIKAAIEMPPDEKKKRMQRMREQVLEHNVYNWGQSIVNELIKLDQ